MADGSRAGSTAAGKERPPPGTDRRALLAPLRAMEHALSTHLFVGHRLTTVWLDRIWNAGIPQVEIFCARQHLDYHDKGQIAELGYWFREADLKLHSVHAPMYSDDVWGRSGPNAVISITEPVKSKRMHSTDEI